MKPLNSKERANAFRRFLIFYVITLLTVILTVVCGFKIPSMQNETLKTQMHAYEKQKMYNISFSTQLATVNGLEKSSQSGDQNDSKIRQGMLELQTFADNDSVEANDFYTDVIRILTDVQNNNQQIRIANGKLTYLQALTLKSNQLDLSLAKSQKEEQKAPPKQTVAVAGTAIKATETKSINYNSKLMAMLDSVRKYKLPVMENFNQYLCLGPNTPVTVNNQKPHTFKEFYNQLKQHKKSELLDVECQTDKNCVNAITVKWKNKAFLGSDKLF